MTLSSQPKLLKLVFLGSFLSSLKIEMGKLFFAAAASSASFEAVMP